MKPDSRKTQKDEKLKKKKKTLNCSDYSGL